jgi:hypothetical protein
MKPIKAKRTVLSVFNSEGTVLFFTGVGPESLRGLTPTDSCRTLESPAPDLKQIVNLNHKYFKIPTITKKPNSDINPAETINQR